MAGKGASLHPLLCNSKVTPSLSRKKRSQSANVFRTFLFCKQMSPFLVRELSHVLLVFCLVVFFILICALIVSASVASAEPVIGWSSFEIGESLILSYP